MYFTILEYYHIKHMKVIALDNKILLPQLAE
jgi:hypothetical protein